LEKYPSKLEAMGSRPTVSGRGDIKDTFDKFAEQKWKNALNMAATETSGWELSATSTEKSTGAFRKICG
jgi:hypothetical protein